jgi:hypothetical protein
MFNVRLCHIRMLPFLERNRTQILASLQNTPLLAQRHHCSRPSQNDERLGKTLKMTKRTPVYGALLISHVRPAIAIFVRDISGRRVNGARCVTYQDGNHSDGRR